MVSYFYSLHKNFFRIETGTLPQIKK